MYLDFILFVDSYINSNETIFRGAYNRFTVKIVDFVFLRRTALCVKASKKWKNTQLNTILQNKAMFIQSVAMAGNLWL